MNMWKLLLQESSSKTSEGKGRQKIQMSVPLVLSVKVVHLPRHMWQKHKWDEQDAVGVLNMFGLCTSQYESPHPQPRDVAGDSQHYVFLLVNQVISKANEAYSLRCPGAGGAGIYIDWCIKARKKRTSTESK